MTQLECRRGPLDGLVVEVDVEDGDVVHLPIKPMRDWGERKTGIVFWGHHPRGLILASYTRDLGQLWHIGSRRVEVGA